MLLNITQNLQHKLTIKDKIMKGIGGGAYAHCEALEEKCEALENRLTDKVSQNLGLLFTKARLSSKKRSDK